MKKEIVEEDLAHLAIGAGILGSGGGGAPLYNQRITQALMRKHGPVPLMQVDDLLPSDLVVPVAFMGAPLVACEKIPTGKEADALLSTLREFVESDRRIVLMPAEIGGANAFTPLWIAARHGLPVLDADSIGRAFPELPMSALHLRGISPAPAYIADGLGQAHTLHIENVHELEKSARSIAISMGSRALVALYLMSGMRAFEAVVRGSLSKAIEIGRLVEEATLAKQNPAEKLAQVYQGKHVATGVIRRVEHGVEKGFLKGKIVIDDHIELQMINEFLLCRYQGELCAASPELICLLEEGSGKPITSAEARWGLAVDLVTLPAPPIWRTKEGMALVGEEIFTW